MKITDEGLKILSISREPEYDEDLDSYLIYEWKGIKYFASLKEPSNLTQDQVHVEITEQQLITISKEDTYASQISSVKGVNLSPAPTLTEEPAQSPPQIPPIIPDTDPTSNLKVETPINIPDQPPLNIAETTPPEEPQVVLNNADAIEEPAAEDCTSNLSILSQITSKYESALLLKYNPDGNSLYLEDVVGKMKPREGFQISLKHASPFRIALQTQQPFHGLYSEDAIVNQTLVQCGVNYENLWISAFPLFKNNQLIGMLIGLSNNSTYKLEDLEIFEGVSFFAAQMLESSKKSVAA